MIRFEDFELDEEESTLKRAGAPVSVEPKAFDLLLYLIRRRNRMVGKDELLDALWPDTHVTTASLTSCLGRLRRSLQDQGSIIKTYHRRGYRFVSELIDAPRPEAPPGSSAPSNHAAREADALGKPPFTGREPQMRLLLDAFAASRAGHGLLALIGGEQGIGKSRLVEELVGRRVGGDALVLTGRCFDGDATPPFLPWVEMLESCVEKLDREELATLLQPGEHDIAQLVPELATYLPPSPAEHALGDSTQARYRLFHQVTSFFRKVSKRRPVILVMEDLHWADRASLLLLRYLARELADVALLVLATYRREEPSEALREVLPGLHMTPSARVVTLSGLKSSEVVELVRGITGQPVEASIGERIYNETDGNPFYVEHLVRHLVERGALSSKHTAEPTDLDMPETARTVIQTRLDRLSLDCRQTLSIASVIGREFELGLLNAVRAEERGHPRSTTLESTLATLEEATKASILEPPLSPSGRYRFAHALLRDTIYRGLGAAERSRRHRRIAEELERTRAGDDRFLAELADHFVQGAASGSSEQAVRYTAAAGRLASARFAFETAAERFGQALAILDLLGEDQTPARIELLIAMAEAYWNAGEPARSRSAAELAADLARHAGMAELFAHAALACELTSAQRPAPTSRIANTVDERYVRFLDEALAGLPEADSELRARVLARLGWASYFHPDRGKRRERLSREAVEMARRLGNSDTLFDTLAERHQALMDPDHTAERLAIANEMLRLANAEGSREALAVSYGMRAWDTAECGAMSAADADMAICGKLATEVHQPVLQCRFLLWQGMRAMLEGRWDDTSRLAQEAFVAGRELDEELAVVNLGNQLLTMHVMTGQLEAAVTHLRDAIRAYPTLPGISGALAYVEALLGDFSAARAVGEECLAKGVEGLPWDSTSLISLGLLSFAYAELRDRDRCAELYAALLPYERLNVILGVNAIACFGPAARALGKLAAALGRWDEACEHFDVAIAGQRSMNARPWLAYTCLEHAQALQGRGLAANRTLFTRRREEAHRLGIDLGIALVVRGVEALP